MSADNAIYYRKIGERWYVMHGSASRDDYSDRDFEIHGEMYETEEECIARANGMNVEYAYTEYGVVESPRSAEELIKVETTRLEEEIGKLAAFKAYVHERLDEAGVPKSWSDSPHTAAGCRIGGRLDWLFARVLDLSEARDTFCKATAIATRTAVDHRRVIDGMSACLDENAVDIIERDRIKERLEALEGALITYRKVRSESDGNWNPRVGIAWNKVIAILYPKPEAPCQTHSG